MSQSARGTTKGRIRDYGRRRVQDLNGAGTPGTSFPKQLRDTDFPSEVGDTVRVLHDPETNQVILEPVEE